MYMEDEALYEELIYEQDICAQCHVHSIIEYHFALIK